MRNQFFLLSILISSTISPIYASEFLNGLNKNCYGSALFDDCKKYLNGFNPYELEGNDERYRYARAYENAYSDDGIRPELSFEIMRGILFSGPSNPEYYSYLIFLHKNYSESIGDDDWWVAFSYALEATREHPKNQFGYFWAASLLDELDRIDKLRDSATLFHLKNFQASAASSDPVENKLYTASQILKRFNNTNENDAAERFKTHVIEQLDLKYWSKMMLDVISVGAKPDIISNSIRQLCNSSLIMFDQGKGCLGSLEALSSLDSDDLTSSAVLKEVLEFAHRSLSHNSLDKAASNILGSLRSEGYSF